MPSTPGVLALPGTGRPLAQFCADDIACRQHATARVRAESGDRAGDESLARSALLGAAVGTVAGAAVGGPRSAGAGAGVGLAMGTVAGVGVAQGYADSVHRRLDQIYVQRMYAAGHQVPLPALSPGAGAAD